MEDEDDEETQEWEMAQVRRAGGWKEEEPEKPAKGSYQPAPSEHFPKLSRTRLILSANSSTIAYDHPRSKSPGQLISPA